MENHNDEVRAMHRRKGRYWLMFDQPLTITQIENLIEPDGMGDHGLRLAKAAVEVSEGPIKWHKPFGGKRVS